MNSDELRSIQKPLKQKYKTEPETAVVTLKAKGKIGEGITCKIENRQSIKRSGASSCHRR